MTLRVVQADVFTAPLPLGEARLVYCDPPYTFEDKHGYGTWPGARSLVERMLELGADDCAYVLHLGWPNLEETLPVLSELAPPRPRYYEGQPPYRILSWVKPWRRNANRPNNPFLQMWEPIVLWYGSAYKNPRGLSEADWICALRSERSANGHATQKPDELLLWIFERLLAGAEGRLAIDLFSGTGAAAIMAARLGLETIAVDRDELFCEKLRENALLPPPELPGYAAAVAVTGHGRPLWPTLGRVELAEPALDEELLATARERKEADVPLAGPPVEAGLEEVAAVGEVEAEAAAVPEVPHRRHRVHDGIVATRSATTGGGE